ncbi:hypothetical protein C8R45DRAFT_123766 [Mycena sanguinolenta]|nr:hypothetical protein C8R45DRAFT_123766 [Mycena sanguinolenta]
MWETNGLCDDIIAPPMQWKKYSMEKRDLENFRDRGNSSSNRRNGVRRDHAHHTVNRLSRLGLLRLFVRAILITFGLISSLRFRGLQALAGHPQPHRDGEGTSGLHNPRHLPKEFSPRLSTPRRSKACRRRQETQHRRSRPQQPDRHASGHS